jgi:hypothetical protein
MKKTFVALTPLCLATALSTINALPAKSYLSKETTWKVNGFVIVKKSFQWKQVEASSLDIFHNGRRVLHRQDRDVWPWTLRNGEFSEAEDARPLKLVDLNGDGVRDLIILSWSGAAYCCYVYEIFSLNGNCKRLFYKDAVYGHLQVFNPNSRHPSFAIDDGTFLFWGIFSHPDAPRPAVHFKWNGTQFCVDRSRMLKPFSHARFNKLRDERKDTKELETMFIELVYSGHAEDALKLIDGWSPKDRSVFLQCFYERIKTMSPFYYQIVAINPPDAIQRLKGR